MRGPSTPSPQPALPLSSGPKLPFPSSSWGACSTCHLPRLCLHSCGSYCRMRIRVCMDKHARARRDANTCTLTVTSERRSASIYVQMRAYVSTQRYTRSNAETGVYMREQTQNQVYLPTRACVRARQKAHVHIHLHVHACQLHMHVHAGHASIFIYTCARMQMYTCADTCKYQRHPNVCICTHGHLYMYTPQMLVYTLMHAYMLSHIDMGIYTHTHTDTDMYS